MEALFGDVCAGTHAARAAHATNVFPSEGIAPRSPRKRSRDESTSETDIDGMSYIGRGLAKGSATHTTKRNQHDIAPQDKKVKLVEQQVEPSAKSMDEDTRRGNETAEQRPVPASTASIEVIEIADSTSDGSKDEEVSLPSSEFCSDASQGARQPSERIGKVRRRKNVYRAVNKGKWTSEVPLLSSSSWLDGDDEL